MYRRTEDYSEDSIPVLDNDNRLLGVITSSNIIDLVDDEMGEDYAMFAGLTAEEDLKEPLERQYEKTSSMADHPARSWHAGFFCSRYFRTGCHNPSDHHDLPVPDPRHGRKRWYPVPGCYHRVLMDESLTGKQKLQLVFKEMRIGFCNGLLLGVLSFAVIGLFIFLFKGKTMMFAFSRFRLHRHRTAAGHADFQCRRHLHSAVL